MPERGELRLMLKPDEIARHITHKLELELRQQTDRLEKHAGLASPGGLSGGAARAPASDFALLLQQHELQSYLRRQIRMRPPPREHDRNAGASLLSIFGEDDVPPPIVNMQPYETSLVGWGKATRCLKKWGKLLYNKLGGNRWITSSGGNTTSL